MTVQTKICGLSTVATIDAAIASGASHIGLNFFANSPRYVSTEIAAHLAARVPARVKIVGIFVNPDPALLAEITARLPLYAVQLHGDESPAFAIEIAKCHKTKIWKAIPVKTAHDLKQADQYCGAVDLILYDAKTPKDAALTGGMGLRFDWELLRGVRHHLPWALSGGLHAGNVAEAVRITGATMVDVASGVESSPGIKDVDKIATFLKATSLL